MSSLSLGQGCEQDVLANGRLLKRMEVCSEPWCAAVYKDGFHRYRREDGTTQLGLNRFSARLLASYPSAMERVAELWPAARSNWTHIDIVLLDRVLKTEYRLSAHRHLPPAKHLGMLYPERAPHVQGALLTAGERLLTSKLYLRTDYPFRSPRIHL